VQEAGWAPGSENLAPTGIRSPARSDYSTKRNRKGHFLRTARELRATNVCQKTYKEATNSSNNTLPVMSLVSLTDKACSKKDRTFATKTLFYNILSTVHFKEVPSTGDTPFPTFLPLLECFLERTFCDGAQFCYRNFLNLRVFKKRPNFLNSSPTSTEGAQRLLSAPSGRF
jgi:hypothetical protein